ncbi:DUF4249 family protein [candidate division KSB1 bacterium]|nr:DUF4249 family protein [candidate division KSB1 bacterium]
MLSRCLNLVASFAIALAVSSCSEQPTAPDFEPKLVVNGFLKLGAGVDSITVSRTVAIDQKFDPALSRVTDASVRVRRQGGNWHQLAQYPPTPVKDAQGNVIAQVGGVYYLPKDSLEVEARATYELSVQALGQQITAQTTVPEQLEIVEMNRGELFGERPLFFDGDTIEYVSGASFADPPFFTVFWNHVPNTTLYRMIADADNGEFANVIRDTTTAANIFKEDLEKREEPFGFNIADDVNLQPMRGRVIWLYYYFYGWHTMRLLAVDEAYALYQQGQFAEGQVQEMPRSNINGGFGVFASYSEVKWRVFVKKGPRSEPE